MSDLKIMARIREYVTIISLNAILATKRILSQLIYENARFFMKLAASHDKIYVIVY